MDRNLRLLACSLESSLELVKTSAGINKLLLTGEERMALGANFNSDLAALGGLGSNYLSASATDHALFVIRMDSRLHNSFYLVSNIPMFFDIVCKRKYYIILFSLLQYLFEKILFLFFTSVVSNISQTT